MNHCICGGYNVIRNVLLNTLSAGETTLQTNKWQISSCSSIRDIDFGQVCITKWKGVNRTAQLFETKPVKLSPREYQETGDDEKMHWFRISVLDL